MRTLVLGASGHLGRNLVAELDRRGHDVIAVARNRSRAESPGPRGATALAGRVAEWRIGAVNDPAFAANLGSGVDAVVSALGVTRQKADPWAIDYCANAMVLGSAERDDMATRCRSGILRTGDGSARDSPAGAQSRRFLHRRAHYRSRPGRKNTTKNGQNQYQHPIELRLGDHELILNQRYEVISIVNDIMLGIWFTIGSVFFFFESLTIPGTWLFLIGSVQMCVRPVIRLSRRIHLQRIGTEQPAHPPRSMDF